MQRKMLTSTSHPAVGQPEMVVALEVTDNRAARHNSSIAWIAIGTCYVLRN